MANKVILKRSSIASKIPQVSDLEFGELAVNYTDGRIYYKDSSNAIQYFERINSTDDLSEGSSNLYYTDTRVNSAIDTRVDKSFVDALDIDANTLDNQVPGYYLNYNNFTNTPTIGNGTLTISGGTGLSGSGTFDANQSSNNTITLNNSDRGSAQAIFKNVAVSGETTINADNNTDTLTFIEGSGIAIETDGANKSVTITATGSAGNDYVDQASFDTANGELTLTRTDSGTVVVDLDGRYLLSGAKAADADLLDGEDGTYYLNYNNFTNTPETTDDLSEGTTNLYYTDTRARNAVSASGDLNYDPTTGVFSVTVPAGYDSTDFDTDFSTKSTDDLSEGSINLYYTNSRVDSRIGTGTLTISGGSGLTGSGTFGANANTNNTITIDHADTSSQGNISTTDGTIIDSISVDTYGHVTSMGTRSLDSRYLQSYTETDTLDSVTDRGNSTTNSIDIGSLDVGSPLASSEAINIDAPSGSPAYIKFWETGSFGMSFGYDGSGSGPNNKLEIRNDGNVTEFEFYNDGRLIASSFSGDGSNLTSVDAATLGGQTSSYHLDYNNFTNTPTIGNGQISITGGNALTGSGTFNLNDTSNSSITINHADTSTQNSVNNSGGTVVQDIGVDGYGHVTSIGSKTLSAGDVGALSTTGKAADADLLDGQDSTYYLNYNNFTNTPTIGNGTLTVSGGSGINASGTFSANQTANTTISVDHADTSTVSNLSPSPRVYVTGLSFDAFGHVTSVSTQDEAAEDVSNLQFFLADGTRSDISLTASNELPFFLANGTQNNIPLAA